MLHPNYRGHGHVRPGKTVFLLFGRVKGIHLLGLYILKQSSGSKFFQTNLQRVILWFKDPYCPLCDSLCLEPEEFDKLNNCNENSDQ